MSAREVSVRQLLAVKTVHEIGSYRRAGEALGYSQAAITAQIAALERALGTTVFDRPGGPRPVILTAAGREVLATATEMLAAIDLLDVRLAAVHDGSWGRLAIGTFQSASHHLLPTVLAELRDHEPDVTITVVESNDNAELMAAVHDGRLDVTFLVGPAADPRLTIHEVCRDPFVVMVNRADELGEVVGLKELAGRPLIGHRDCVCHEIVDHGFAAAGLTPRFAFRSNDNAAVQAMVRAGIGTALMPALSVNYDDPNVRIVRMAPALPSRSILVAYPKKRPAPTAVTFAERAILAGKSLSL